MLEVKNVTIQFTSAIQGTDFIQVTEGNGFSLLAGSKITGKQIVVTSTYYE